MTNKQYWDKIVDGHIKDHLIEAFKDHRNIVGSLSINELEAIPASGSFPTGAEWLDEFKVYYLNILNGGWVAAFTSTAVGPTMINTAVDRFVNQYDADKKKQFASATASLLNLSLFSWAVFKQITTHPDMVDWILERKK